MDCDGAEDQPTTDCWTVSQSRVKGDINTIKLENMFDLLVYLFLTPWQEGACRAFLEETTSEEVFCCVAAALDVDAGSSQKKESVGRKATEPVKKKAEKPA